MTLQKQSLIVSYPCSCFHAWCRSPARRRRAMKAWPRVAERPSARRSAVRSSPSARRSFPREGRRSPCRAIRPFYGRRFALLLLLHAKSALVKPSPSPAASVHGVKPRSHLGYRPWKEFKDRWQNTYPGPWTDFVRESVYRDFE